ncbi:sensor histidine kinase [Streptomyces sp. NPDC057910]|uniref:sensor histidine kinase n=1 Tax=Streptomyces sp. NPDC057910 TaxID=3346278 RepID=UPI0036EC6A83
MSASPSHVAAFGTAADRVQTLHDMRVYRMRSALQLGFVVILAGAIAAEASSAASAQQMTILACYTTLGLAAFVASFWVVPKHSIVNISVALGIADIIAAVWLQVLSNGSLLLILVLFVPPMLSALQSRPSVALLITALSIGSGVGILSIGPAIRPQFTLSDAVVSLALFLLVGLIACVGSFLQAYRTCQITNLLRDRSRLLAEVITAEERQRQLLAESLHDGPLQAVLAARLDLSAYLESNDNPEVDRANKLLLDTARQLRQFTYDLHPAVIEAAGVGGAIESLVRAAEERGITTRCSVDTTSPHPADRVLLGAARELIANVIRHSNAVHLQVTLTHRDGFSVLTVIDDGVGFNTKRINERLAAGHIGLASQRVRIEAAGGSLRYVPVSCGTHVQVRVPRSPDYDLE